MTFYLEVAGRQVSQLMLSVCFLGCLLTTGGEITAQDRLKLISERDELEMQIDIWGSTPPAYSSGFQSRKTFERLREIESSLIGEDIPEGSRMVMRHANEAAMRGDYESAVKLVKQYTSLITQVYGAEHWRASQAGKVQSSILAEAVLQPAQHTRLRQLVGDVNSCNKPANAAEMRVNLEKLEAVRTEMRMILNHDHELLGHVYTVEFRTLMQLGEFMRAREISRRQREVHEPVSLPGESHLQVIMTDLANVEQELGYIDEAYKLLTANEILFVGGEPAVLNEGFWNIKAKVLYRSGAFTPAIESIDKYLQLRQLRFPWDIRSQAVGLGSKGAMLSGSGDLNAAIPVLRQAIELATKADDPITESRARLSLAEVLRDLNRFEESESEALKSLNLRVSHLSAEHPDTIRCLKCLAVIQLRQKNNIEAARLTTKALDGLMKNRDEQRILYSELRNLDGIIKRRLGQDELAAESFREAEKVPRGSVKGSLISKFERLSLQVEMKVESAEEELEYVIKQLGSMLSPREAVLAYETLATARLQRADVAGAIKAMDTSRRALRVHRQSNLPGLSQTEQLFLANAERPVGRTQAYIQFAYQAQQPGLTALTLEWVINDKGFVNEVLGDVHRFNRSQGSAQNKSLSEELQVIRGSIAKELAAGEAAEKSSLVKLQKRAEEIALQMGLTARPSVLTRQWLTVQHLRKYLAEDSVLVDVLRTSPDQSSTDQEDQYFAWIIPPHDKGEVQLVHLGSAASIDALVTEFRTQMQAMQSSAEISTVNRAIRTQLNLKAAEVTKKLARQILGLPDAEHPDKHTGILPHITRFRRWMISPDAALWLFPWDTLPLPQDNQLVAHQHVVSYLSSSRQLTNPSVNPRSTNTLALFDPAFGEGNYRPAFLDQQPPWTQLPGTAEQYGHSKEYLRKLSGIHSELSGKNASEEAFRNGCGTLGELFVATHGYSALAANDSQELAGDTASNRLFQPLQFCGLVMAGGNQSPEKDQDNYLSGEDIMQLDLDGCNVFCTACVSGLGLNQDGQGVASLTQAFQLAGARSLVTTLWEVQQQTGTVSLMKEYWKLRASNVAPVDALAGAKLAVLTDPTTSHPYFWAGFTATAAPVTVPPQDPPTPAADLTSANLLLKWSKYDEALNVYDSLLPQKNTADVLAGRGCALLGLDREDEAIDCLKRAITKEPDHMLAQFGIVWHAIKKGNASAIATEARTLAGQHPMAAHTSFLHGLLLIGSAAAGENRVEKLQRLREIEKLLGEAAFLDPDLLEASHLHGLICGAIASEVATTAAQDPSQITVNPESRLWLEKSVQSFDNVEDRNDQYADLYLFRANAKQQLYGRNSPLALIDCCRACNQDPDTAPFLKLLVQSLYLPEIQSQTQMAIEIEKTLSCLPLKHFGEIATAQKQLHQIFENGAAQLSQIAEKIQEASDPKRQQIETTLKQVEAAKEHGDEVLQRILKVVNKNP